MTDNLKLSADIVAAYVSHNQVPAAEIAPLLAGVYGALLKVGEPEPERKPAVPISKSIGDDFIICLEDGRKLKTLKRYLRRFNLTPEQYRAKWRLPADYPMTSPAYARLRSTFAKSIGLGRRS